MDNFGYKTKWKNVLFVILMLFLVWMVFGGGRQFLDTMVGF